MINLRCIVICVVNDHMRSDDDERNFGRLFSRSGCFPSLKSLIVTCGISSIIYKKRKGKSLIKDCSVWSNLETLEVNIWNLRDDFIQEELIPILLDGIFPKLKVLKLNTKKQVPSEILERMPNLKDLEIQTPHNLTKPTFSDLTSIEHISAGICSSEDIATIQAFHTFSPKLETLELAHQGYGESISIDCVLKMKDLKLKKLLVDRIDFSIEELQVSPSFKTIEEIRCPLSISSQHKLMSINFPRLQVLDIPEMSIEEGIFESLGEYGIVYPLCINLRILRIPMVLFDLTFLYLNKWENLEELEIFDYSGYSSLCSTIPETQKKQVDKNFDTFSFPSLKEMEISYLISFSNSFLENLAAPNLERLIIVDCGDFLASNWNHTITNRLKYLELQTSSQIDENLFAEEDCFPNLRELSLSSVIINCCGEEGKEWKAGQNKLEKLYLNRVLFRDRSGKKNISQDFLFQSNWIKNLNFLSISEYKHADAPLMKGRNWVFLNLVCVVHVSPDVFDKDEYFFRNLPFGERVRMILWNHKLVVVKRDEELNTFFCDLKTNEE